MNHMETTRPFNIVMTVRTYRTEPQKPPDCIAEPELHQEDQFMEFSNAEWNRVVADTLATGLDSPLACKRKAANLLAATLADFHSRPVGRQALSAVARIAHPR
jgi:hypothetical protein